MTPLTPEVLRAHPLPRHESTQSKEGRGAVLVVGGSLEVPGGVLLAAVGALRAGAGRLRIATCRGVAAALGVAVPEARVIGLPETETGGIAPEAAERLAGDARWVDTFLIGPGMMDPDATRALVAALLDRVCGPDGPSLVLDAGALAGLHDAREALHRHGGRAVLTPHAGEMARLLDVPREAVEADPPGAARRVAEALRSVVVMKGGRTHVVAPGGEAWLFEGGTVGLATSGSGDTLAGVIAGLLARGAEPTQAAMWGVHLHGEAGRRMMRRYGGIGFLARELLAEVPVIMAELQG